MADRRHLRPVGPDERMPEKSGSYAVILEDLETARGMVVEATAEAAECPGDPEPVVKALDQAEAALTGAIWATRVEQLRQT